MTCTSEPDTMRGQGSQKVSVIGDARPLWAVGEPTLTARAPVATAPPAAVALTRSQTAGC